MTQDPYKYFRVEARELLDQLGRGVLGVEKSSSPERISHLLRLAHTLKGAARVVKQRAIADSAHALEDALAVFRDSSTPVPLEVVEVVLRLLDGMSRELETLGDGGETKVKKERPLPDEPFRVVRADMPEMDALLDGVVFALAKVESLRRSAVLVEKTRRLADSLVDKLGAPRPRDAQTSNAGIATSVRWMAEELQGALGTLSRDLGTSISQLDAELQQVRGTAEQLRLIPAGILFTSLERTARDAAQAVGKTVAFVGRGGDVRLDAQVLATLQGALVQVVRNAVAHGIEVESQRRARGKAAEGQVVLEVARRGRRVVFTCSDDGAGVDIGAVRQVLERRGVRPAETHTLDSEALLHLLLRGGISTSGAITEVSGRGVGLDVVREAAEQVGGRVAVRTTAGQGTTIEIAVPLSLASLEALLVEAGGRTLAIPLDAVVRTTRAVGSALARTPEGDSLVHEGRVIPFVSLSRLLRTGRSSPPPLTFSTVVVRGRERLAAIAVDRLLGTSNVVLRPLPDLAPALAVVSGASLDSDGNPQLVLDPEELVREAHQAGADEVRATETRLPILVIDDSLTTRMLEQSILESAGYEVEVATSGEEGLEKARRPRYALFLVDVEMPGIDGFTFIERASEDAALRDVPAILVTSRASPEDRRRGEEVGARAYIVKSEFDQGFLLERIRRLAS